MRISPTITFSLSIAFGFAAILVARHFTAENKEADAIEVVEAAPVQMVPVVIATEGFARGETVDMLKLTIEDWPADQAPFGRFESIESVGATDYTPRKAMTEIAAGEPLLDSRLSPAGMRPSLAGRLTPGYRAYTIPMSDISGVGGFVLPGDRVDVLHTRPSSTNTRNPRPMAELLLENIEVLGVGLNDDLRSDQPAEFPNATLSVSVEDAKRLSVASETGTLSLALRGTRDTEVTKVADATPKPAAAPRPVRRPRQLVRRPVKPEFGKVEVILGEAKTVYTVPAKEANAQP